LVPTCYSWGDVDLTSALAAAHGDLRWTTNLAEALAGSDEIFMDCAATGDRPARVRQAIEAGKHIHIEKPTAPTVEEAMELARLAHKAGVKHGVIQDKLFLPGPKLLFVKFRLLPYSRSKSMRVLDL
jgi:predicted dehydrogenase